MRLLYFAWVREAIGTGEQEVTVPAAVTSVGALIDWLTGQGEPYAVAFADRARLRAAVDGVFAGLDTSIEGATEVSIFPPVTGG